MPNEATAAANLKSGEATLVVPALVGHGQLDERAHVPLGRLVAELDGERLVAPPSAGCRRACSNWSGSTAAGQLPGDGAGTSS